jgi:KUP system potassium uptake protein
VVLAGLPGADAELPGQSGLVLRKPAAIESPFFLLVPHWAGIPMVVLATAATVIASQAVISGAFSMSRQAVELGFLPRVTVRHTSEHAAGQIYVPVVNWTLFFAVVRGRHRLRILRATRQRVRRGG